MIPIAISNADPLIRPVLTGPSSRTCSSKPRSCGGRGRSYSGPGPTGPTPLTLPPYRRSLMDSLVSLQMTSLIDHTTIDCRNAYALSTFWTQVLGFTDVPGDPNEPGHEECMIIDPTGGQKLLFIEVPEDKQVKNRIHFDLVPTDRTRDEEI